MLRRVALLLFGSGFSALVYQTAWQRLFQLTFGASTAASAAVLAIFLGGLGVGGLVFGRRVERSKKPLLVYAHLELGIAAWTAITPFLRSAVHHLYLALGGTETLGIAGATAVRLVLAALVIGPSAVLMGGTLPAAARAVVSDADGGRRGLALLYALNTLGAVAGALAGPLVLFGFFGTKLTLWAAVAANLAVAVVARALGRNAPDIDVATPIVAEASAAAPRRTIAWTYFAAAATGLAFLSLELVWYRVLSPLLGGTTVTFGLILATALFGIGTGGFLFALRSSERRTSLELVVTTLAAEALCVLVPFAWGDDLALVAAHLRHMSNLGHGYLLAGWFFVAFVVVFPASAVSGYQFPALLALLGRGRAGIGRHVGEAYAWNTLGTLFGSLLTGFVLLPVLGAVATWRLVALVLVALAVFGAVLAWHGSKRLARIGPALVVAAVAIVASTSSGPGAVFRHSPVGAGRMELAELTPNQVLALERETEDMVIWQRDGVESSVAINVINGIAFIVNGKSDGAVVDDRGMQAFAGLLTAALHPNPKRAFVVGLGTGMTAGLLARAPGIERVDVAELEPSVVEVARRSALANGNALENPRVHVLVGDGREVLLASDRQYDLVVSEPSNPYRAGIASLFTREFYEAGASRLGADGLFAQWIQSYEIDGRTLGMALRTLGAVFPYVSVWSAGGGDLVLLASQKPQVVDVARLRGVLAGTHYLEWMRRAWNMEGAEALVAHHIAPPAAVLSLVEGMRPPVNTDDLNLLEVSFTRHVGDNSYSATRDLFEALDVRGRRPTVTGSLDWALVDDLRHRVDWDGYVGLPPSPRAQATKLGCDGSMTRAEKLWPPGQEPSDMVEIWVVGSIEAIHGADSALARAEALERGGFVAEAMLVRSRLLEAHGEIDRAVRLLVEAFGALRKTALPLCDATTRALNRARSIAATHPATASLLLDAVASAPLAIYQSEQYRRVTREIIGMRSKDPRLCANAFDARYGRTGWDLSALTARARCREAVGAPDAPLARRELEAFLANEPESLGRGARASAESTGKED
ncbi:MAG TPA: fused MFS/spermidine synthase [Polyangiaceae bacterium]